MRQIQERNQKAFEDLQTLFRDPKVPQKARREAVGLYNKFVEEGNEWQQFNDPQLQKTLSGLQKHYQVDDSDVALYAEKFQGDPFSATHPVRFAESIRKNPNMFKWREVGQSLFKPLGENKVEYVNSNGQVVSFEKSKILKPTGQFRTNPVTKSKEPIMGIDYDVALDAAQGDPEVVKAITNYADLRIPQLEKAMPNASMEELKEVAGKEAMDKLFAGLGGAVYKQDVTTEYGKARQRAQAGEDVKTVVSEVDISTNIKENDGTEEGTTTRVNLGRGLSVKSDKPIYVGPNRRVFLFGANKKQLQDLEDSKAISQRQPDGSYLLNFGFTVREWQEPQNILQVTKRTAVQDKRSGKWITKEVGDVISPAQAAIIRSAGFGNNLRNIKEAYRIGPATFQVDEENDKLVGPSFSAIDIFIPKGIGETPELDNVPRKSGKKSKPDIGL